MTRYLWIQGIGGASGDMLLAALTGLGVEPREIEEALRPLGLGPFRIAVRDACDRGIRGRRLSVHIGEDAGGFSDSNGASSAASSPTSRRCDHLPHHHSQPPAAGHGAPHPAPAHPHRSWRDIRTMISASNLPAAVRDLALDAFRRLAEAEGAVHGMPAEDIAFHEVGAVDSIVDIVGACFARERLGVEGVRVDPLPIAGGTVVCAHGEYPLPAPATLELLRGWPIEPADEKLELVTPTGAALLRSWANLDRWPAGCRIAAAAYGLGGHQLRHRPNVLRATLLDTAPEAAPTDECLALECNVDDQTPELLGALCVRLLEAGALDVFTVPAMMKKQRPAALLTVLARPADRDRFLDILFRESTTFGVRERWTRRHVLDRGFETVSTPHGPVRVKVGRWRGAVTTRAPEMEDCLRVAAERNVAPRVVYEAALAAALQR